jgi:hypothetical protein
MNIAEQEVAAFLPPQRPLGRSKRAAKAVGQFIDRRGRGDDLVELWSELFDPLGHLRRCAADTAAHGNAARGDRHGQHVPA